MGLFMCKTHSLCILRDKFYHTSYLISFKIDNRTSASKSKHFFFLTPPCEKTLNNYKLNLFTVDVHCGHILVNKLITSLLLACDVD